jgi:glucan phosphoethanolaminetransferase (alkaline phosphatase superfamily)
MEINSLFGLPAHPLVVHAAVVMLPLAAILTLVVAIWPGSRKWWAPLALGLAFVSTFAVGLAQQSGEQLQEQVKNTQLVRDHAAMGQTVFPWAVAVTIMAAIVVAIEPLSRRYPNTKLKGRGAHIALVVVTAVVASGAMYTIIQVGHSGAKATWDKVGAPLEVVALVSPTRTVGV